SLSDPLLLEGTARPWREAGYTLEYRRYFPHLTHADLARYKTVLFLLGREPDEPSDTLTTADLFLLSEWLSQGGAVVIGYDQSGSIDRNIANRWLAAQ